MKRRVATLLALVATSGTAVSLGAATWLSPGSANADPAPDAAAPPALATTVSPVEAPAAPPPLEPAVDPHRAGSDGGTQTDNGPGSTMGRFRLEPAPAFDDVFGDAARYRATLDRALQLADAMQRTRDGYTRAAQQVIVLLGAQNRPKQSKACAQLALAATYARADRLGQRYLDAGRELARHHDQVRDLDRLGESAGLTPDYRAKLRRVVTTFDGLLGDYRAMKATFHDQLDGELRYAGCDPARLLASAPPSTAAPGDDKDHDDAQPVAATIDSPPSAPPSPAPSDRSGILFYIDNTRCSIATQAALDGRVLGLVPANTRAAFQTSPGPHDLCLLPVEKDAPGRRCGDPGTLRTAYFHEGWTISLRCE